MANERRVEDAGIGRTEVSRFVSELEPKQFEVMYGLTGGLTAKEIAERNDMTLNEVKRIHDELRRKSILLTD